jgi:hypothetical protein
VKQPITIVRADVDRKLSIVVVPNKRWN